MPYYIGDLKRDPNLDIYPYMKPIKRSPRKRRSLRLQVGWVGLPQRREPQLDGLVKACKTAGVFLLGFAGFLGCPLKLLGFRV